MTRYRYTGQAGAVLLGLGWDDSAVEGKPRTTGPLVVEPGDFVLSDNPLAAEHPVLQLAPKPEPKPATESKDDK